VAETVCLVVFTGEAVLGTYGYGLLFFDCHLRNIDFGM